MGKLTTPSNSSGQAVHRLSSIVQAKDTQQKEGKLTVVGCRPSVVLAKDTQQKEGKTDYPFEFLREGVKS